MDKEEIRENINVADESEHEEFFNSSIKIIRFFVESFLQNPNDVAVVFYKTVKAFLKGEIDGAKYPNAALYKTTKYFVLELLNDKKKQRINDEKFPLTETIENKQFHSLVSGLDNLGLEVAIRSLIFSESIAEISKSLKLAQGKIAKVFSILLEK